MNFTSLIQNIQQTHTALQQYASKAINRGLTIRNWLTGFYITEFEQKGDDRAAYGTRLISSLAKNLNSKSLSEGNLKVYRQFYHTYPQIRQSITDQLRDMGFASAPISQLLIGELQTDRNQSLEIGQSAIGQLDDKFYVPPDKLISKLSYTHLVQLFPVTDPLKRCFYEIECIKGGGIIL